MCAHTSLSVHFPLSYRSRLLTAAFAIFIFVPLSLFAFSARKSHITRTQLQQHPDTCKHRERERVRQTNTCTQRRTFQCHLRPRRAYALHFVADSSPCTINSISPAISTCFTLCLGHNGIVMQLTATVTTAFSHRQKLTDI